MNLKAFFLLLIFVAGVASAQNKEEAEKVVEAGISHHDKGEFEEAVLNYNKALELDKDNLLALAERAYSLLSLQKYDLVIEDCKKAIKKHPRHSMLSAVYVTYGNAMDAMNKKAKSIEVYDEGISLFPDYYQLHYNRGVTLAGMQKFEEAIVSFQKAVSINPDHASSHNGIARLSNATNKKVPSLLAYCRFLILEPGSNRSKENLASLQNIINGSAKKTGENSVNINISMDMFGGSKGKGKVTENNFSTTELIMALGAGLDYDSINRNKTTVEKFIRKFSTVCASLSESSKGNYGFYWEYYVPFFVALKEKKFIETSSYVMFNASADTSVTEWLQSHSTEVEAFYEWVKEFKWSSKLTRQ